jgi:hypothetical protein
VTRAAIQVSLIHRVGLGYSGETWRNSGAIRRVEALPPGTVVYTNGPDAIYIRTGRLAQWIPSKSSKDYPAKLSAMTERLRSGSAVLVYFDVITWRRDLLAEEELKQALPLIVVERTTDGSIYRIAQ